VTGSGKAVILSPTLIVLLSSFDSVSTISFAYKYLDVKKTLVVIWIASNIYNHNHTFRDSCRKDL